MSDLPDRIIVDAKGAYWRDYGDHYSMCPVSEDNDPVVIHAVYERPVGEAALQAAALVVHVWDHPEESLSGGRTELAIAIDNLRARLPAAATNSESSL